MPPLDPLPPSDYDGPWKDALELGFPHFLATFFPAQHAELDWTRDHEFLHQELQALTPASARGMQRVDLLVKAYTPAGDARYIHIEQQMTREAGFARRLEDYRCAVRLHFNEPVASIGILGDGDAGWLPDRYEEGVLGCQASARFLLLKLVQWQEKLAELEANANIFCLFVAAHLEAVRTRQDAQERRQAKVRLLLNLVNRELDPAEGRAWYRLIDWILGLHADDNRWVYEEVRKQRPEGQMMPYISYAEQVGMEKGLEKGLEKGITKGELAGLRRLLKLQLETKFGAEGAALLDQVGPDAPADRFEAIGKAVMSAVSLDDLRPLFAPPNGTPAT